MKRIIYSIFTEDVEEHSSVPDFKRQQFKKYKDKILEAQKSYALYCNADYELFSTDLTNYDNIQFQKLFLFEELTEKYDEIIYFDFDIVPQTKENIFEKHDLNNICAYGIVRKPETHELRWKLQKDNWHRMDIYAKTCAKNAMLLLDDEYGNDELINTGVVCGNKTSIELLQFKNRFSLCEDKLKEAIIDNLYPREISSIWRPNNEIYISYIIEKFKVPYTNIGIQWNFFLDKLCPTPSSGAHILHHVNKEFELSFNA